MCPPSSVKSPDNLWLPSQYRELEVPSHFTSPCPISQSSLANNRTVPLPRSQNTFEVDFMLQGLLQDQGESKTLSKITCLMCLFPFSILPLLLSEQFFLGANPSLGSETFVYLGEYHLLNLHYKSFFFQIHNLDSSHQIK